MLSALVFSCQDETPDSESSSKPSEKKAESSEKDRTITDLDQIPNLKRNLERLKQEQSKHPEWDLPDSLEWEKIEKIEPGLVLSDVVSSGDAYFITNFHTESDVETEYLLSFTPDGRVIDDYQLGSNTFGTSTKTKLLNENLFRVIKTDYEGFELDGYGNETYEEKAVTSEYVSFSEMGVFEIWKNENPVMSIENESEIYRFYDIISKSIIGANEYEYVYRSEITARSEGEDVYESLEGGGLYSKALEVRTRYGLLKAIFCYKAPASKNTMPKTYSMAVASKNCEIMNYHIISSGGNLYLKVVEHNSITNEAQVTFFNYGERNVHSYPLLKEKLQYEEAQYFNNSSRYAEKLTAQSPDLEYRTYQTCSESSSPKHQFMFGAIYSLKTKERAEEHYFYFSDKKEITTMVISSRDIDEPFEISAEPLKTTFTFEKIEDNHLKVSKSRNSIMKKGQELCGITN